MQKLGGIALLLVCFFFFFWGGGAYAPLDAESKRGTRSLQAAMRGSLTLGYG